MISIDDAFAAAQKDLAALVAVPGVSAPAFPQDEVRRSADSVATLLTSYGLSNVQLLESNAVYGETAGRADEPVVLVYGHHDVQPPGRVERWISPPFQASIRDGRMYGRGTADDKGGFLAYLAAVRACAGAGALPCRVKVLIEGEEEIGSPHLAALLEEHRRLLAADFIVLCDTPNFATGVPALTYRLRGNCIVDVEVRSLERPLHSGQAGGLAPDATMILCRLLASLDLGPLIERVEIDAAQLDAMRALPFDRERVRRNFGFRDGVDVIADSWASVWAKPSLAITAFESIPVAHAANQITDAARARLSLRTTRPIEAEEAGKFLADALRSGGAPVDVRVLGGPSWWEADPKHPIFAAARRALTKGFGTEAVMIGSGGSIGFVKPFADLAGDIPPLLTGVQDPQSNAHSENESLHLGDWRKAMTSAVYLFQELACYDTDSH